MKIAISGGAGAMGGLFGARLAGAGHDVTLLDVAAPAVRAINDRGLRVQPFGGGAVETVRLRATAQAAEIGPVDLLVFFVKGRHTQAAAEAARPAVGGKTEILTLQNGWGNAPRIESVFGSRRVLAGVTLHSATLVAPGQVHHAGVGPTTIGELDGRVTPRVQAIAQVLRAVGDVEVSREIVKVIWSKLCLNVCALPACALLRFYSGELVRHEGTMSLMKELLREAVAVAHAQGIGLDCDERWEAIQKILHAAATVRASMLQDVEVRRLTEIDTINGAVIEAGLRHGVPTPHNQTMVWLVKALEGTFAPGYESLPSSPGARELAS